jgi:catechol 2,3-dioxygenase-like lactoylglutathione lyase family enzyme
MSSAYTAPLPMQLFHYHLVTRKAREVEARYVAKLGFELIARHGRVGEEPVSFEPGVSWEELDARGFQLRLSELERGAVNIVVQPGQWVLPRVDHLGVVLDEDAFAGVVERAAARGLRVQERSGRRTFVATGAGYRLELHPPRDWIDELLEKTDELRLAELHLLADDPEAKARALGAVLDLDARRDSVELGETVVRFLPGGPAGRPELHAELFL